MSKKKVLFVCIHNSARSQMAESLLNQMCGDEYEAQSAGLEAGTLNPLAVEALRGKGMDIGGKRTQTTAQVLQTGAVFDYVVTVCDETSAERCPVFPGAAKRLHWSFPDPSGFAGTWEEKLEQTRTVRDAIEEKVRAFCSVHCPQAETAADNFPS